MEAHLYRLALADGAHGPGNVPPFAVKTRRLIPAPALPNWQSQSILASVEVPFKWHGELVSYVTITPRYTTDSLLSIEGQGGVVGVSRVRPGENPLEWEALAPAGIDYWGVGVLTVVEV
jgi:hypothetical protein